MRYFLISYQANIDGYVSAFGDMMIHEEEMPHRKTLTDKLKELHPNLIGFVILGMFEFKNEIDYVRFRVSDKTLSKS